MRYVVGIAVTAVVGRYAIQALNRYLERQKLAEALPDQERRKELSYDVALARLAKSVCPGCERPVDLKNEKIDFCPHWRHRPVRPLRPLQHPQERVCTVLPCLRHRGGRETGAGVRRAAERRRQR